MDDAIHEIDVFQFVMPVNGGLVFFEARVFFIHHVHITFGRDELERQPSQYAERSERAVHHLENEGVLIVGFANQDLAFGGDHFVFRAGVVKPAMDEGHRFDGAARDGAADGDGLEFGDDDGYEAVAHGGFDQIHECDARFGNADPLFRIDMQNPVEIADVDFIVFAPEIIHLGHLVRYGFFARGYRLVADAITQLCGDSFDLGRVRGFPRFPGDMLGADGAPNAPVFLDSPIRISTGADEQRTRCFGHAGKPATRNERRFVGAHWEGGA